MRGDTRARVMRAATAPLAGFMAGSAGVRACQLLASGQLVMGLMWLVVALSTAAVAIAVTLAIWRTLREPRS